MLSRIRGRIEEEPVRLSFEVELLTATGLRPMDPDIIKEGKLPEVSESDKMLDKNANEGLASKKEMNVFATQAQRAKQGKD